MESAEANTPNPPPPSSATATAERPEPRRPRRHRVRKWLARLSAVVLALLLLIFIVIEIVLRTGLPKSLVVGQVENGLGLRMAVGSLTTGWLGHTTMHDVKIALPISQQAFFDVPEMNVRHTNLLAMILGWPVQIKYVELRNPVLYVRQGASGKWNLQQLAELLAKTAGQKTGQQTASTSAPVLPILKIEGLTIDVLDNKGRAAKVQPVNVDGSPDRPAWKYDVEVPSGQPNVPPHLSVVGRVAPGGLWQHEAVVWVHEVGQWIQPFVPTLSEPLAAHVKWTGQLGSSGMSGFLEIVDASYGIYHVDGALAASQNGSTVSISPRNLHLSEKDLSLPPERQSSLNVVIPAGTIEYDGAVARATRVQLNVLGGPITLNGSFEPALSRGELEAYWQNLQVPNSGITQSGKLNLTFARPTAAPMQVHLSANTHGTAPQGSFNAAVGFDVSGQTFNDLNWKLSAPQLVYNRAPKPIVLDGLSAAGTVHRDTDHLPITLTSVSLPADNRLAGSGSYDLITRQGHVRIQGQDWPLHLIEGSRLAFVIDASGQGVQKPLEPGQKPDAKPGVAPLIELTEFTLRSGDTTLSMHGTYDGRRPKPVDVEVRFVNQPTAPAAAQVGPPSLLHGYLTGQATLAGVIGGPMTPTSIDLQGTLEGRDAMILGHPLGDISTKLVGSIDDQRATIRADGIPLLGGIWNLGGTYVMREGNKPVYATTVDLAVERLPLPRATEFLGAPRVDGTFAGRWYVYFPGLKPTVNSIRLTGSGRVKGLAYSPLVADELTFTTALQDGTFSIDPIRLTRGNYGRVDASARVELANWRQINTAVQITNFPVDMPNYGAGLQLSGGSKQIVVSLPNAAAKDEPARKLRADGGLDVRSVISIESQPDKNGHRTMQPEGTVRTLIDLHGRVADLRQLRGDLLGGTISGDGVADVDTLFTQSRLNFAWDHLQTERLVRLYPGAQGFGGAYSGTLRIAPATIPRPLEPLAVDIESRAANGHWRTVKIGDAQVHAFLGANKLRFTDAHATVLNLIASDGQPSGIDIGGGRVEFWFSSSGHVDLSPKPDGTEEPSGITVSNQLNLTLRSLDVDQFVRAFEPKYPSGNGRLSGTVFLLSAPRTRTLAAIAASTSQPTTGPAATTAEATAIKHLLATTMMDANLTLEYSDLAHFGPIAFLYNALHVGFGPQKPIGHGTIAAHMEAGRLHISRLYYFNRGVEVYGVATIDQLWNFPDSPISGNLVGTIRPLKNIRLPLLAEADVILSAVQKQGTDVQFGGTVRHPGDYQIVSLAQIGAEIRGVLLGEVGQSGR